MYPAAFDYLRASSVEEALSLLDAHDDAKLLAGGHSLIPMMKLRLAQPATVIDIGRIASLSGISESGGALTIGPLTTHAEIAASTVVQKHCAFLAEAAGHIGDQQVRNRGTIGGNIAHADPASDLPAVLRAANATIHLQSSSGKRSVAASDFFLDLLATELQEKEVLTAIEIPALAAGTGTAYLKFEHPASGYAVVGAAAAVTMSGGKCTQASLAFNGVTSTPLVLDVSSLAGGSCDDAAIAGVTESIQAQDPLSDVFASGDYRVHLASVFGRRALAEARDRA
jgi:carbon-monoxide dehydrogenase medium subunit